MNQSVQPRTGKNLMAEDSSDLPAHGAESADDEKPPHLIGPISAAAADTSSGCEPDQMMAFRQAARAKLSPRLSGENKSALKRRDAFRKRFFPGSSEQDWNSWFWQVKNRITGLERLSAMLDLSRDEVAAFGKATPKLPLSITPYFMSLIDPHDPRQALRRTAVPTVDEMVVSPGESEDPLNEDEDTVVPGLVHRYPDRVLLLVTGSCSTYCRYCTRHRMVAGRRHDCYYNRHRLEAAVAYIRRHPEVRDVLLSGGDPLLMVDRKIEWLLKRLRRIEHVELIRIGTKTPAVLPQRITPELVAMLARYHPLFMSLHFTHPDELTQETRLACNRLADAGIPLGSQTVLLKGVNDDPAVLRKLFHGLLTMRVRPYYLYQCDPIPGSAHFRTPVSSGLDIIRNLRGHTTGYAVPTYVIDAPGGGGKIALYPEAVVGREGGSLVLRNFEGRTFTYPDQVGFSEGLVH